MDDEEELGPDAQEADDERNGRLTTIIPRPANRRASDAGRSRLGRRRRDATSDRISSRRSGWLFGLAAVVVAGAIAAALFVLPVRTWFDQDDQLDALDNELDEMRSVNDDLTDEVDRLQTDEGVIEAAREELGQIQANENRQTMLAPPDLPREMPDGWPYTQVDQILTASANAAAAEAAGVPPPGESDSGTDDEPGGGAGGFQPVTGGPTTSDAGTTSTVVTTATTTSVAAATTTSAVVAGG